jgi:ActR/RegA family two-component response regulator
MPALDKSFPPLPTPATSTYRVLLVDDDDTVLQTLKLVLESDGFKVVSAASVNQALKCISCQTFDVLVSDLHMPELGDGLTVVSAMRHANPRAVTVIFSSFPEMQLAADAILKQTDEVVIKPQGVGNLVHAIRERLQKGVSAPSQQVESVADILERETPATIDDLLARIDHEPLLIPVKLTRKERARYLPQLLRDLVRRLRSKLPLGTRPTISPAASRNGMSRRRQGYTPAMLTEESRLLQISIFHTLERNLQRVDYSIVLRSVMAISDEIASQLAQAVACYHAGRKWTRSKASRKSSLRQGTAAPSPSRIAVT